MESQYTNETGEDQSLLSIDNNEQILTQESDKDNEKDQDSENETVEDTKPVVEKPAKQEMGKML
eukprot:14690297-Ditylum_brightwellii.AAC.1